MKWLAALLEVERDLSPQLRKDLPRQPLALARGSAEVVVEALGDPAPPALKYRDPYGRQGEYLFLHTGILACYSLANQ